MVVMAGLRLDVLLCFAVLLLDIVQRGRSDVQGDMIDVDELVGADDDSDTVVPGLNLTVCCNTCAY